MYVYIYIYIYICVCAGAVPGTTFNTDTSYMTKALIQARTLTQAPPTLDPSTLEYTNPILTTT